MQVMLAAWIFFCGRHVSLSGALKTWVPSACFVFVLYLMNS